MIYKADFTNLTNLNIFYLCSASFYALIKFFCTISLYLNRRQNKQKTSTSSFICSLISLFYIIFGGALSIFFSSNVLSPIIVSLSTFAGLIKLLVDLIQRIHYDNMHYLKKKINKLLNFFTEKIEKFYKSLESNISEDACSIEFSDSGSILSSKNNDNLYYNQSLESIHQCLEKIKSIIDNVENNKDIKKTSYDNLKIISNKKIFHNLSQLLILISSVDSSEKDLQAKLQFIADEAVKIMINQNYYIDVLNDTIIIVDFFNKICPKAGNDTSIENDILQSILPYDFNAIRNTYTRSIKLNRTKIDSSENWCVLIARNFGLDIFVHCCSSKEKKNLQADVLKQIPSMINFYQFSYNALYENIIDLRLTSDGVRNEELKQKYDLVIRFFLESMNLFEKRLDFYGLKAKKPTENLHYLNVQGSNFLNRLN